MSLHLILINKIGKKFFKWTKGMYVKNVVSLLDKHAPAPIKKVNKQEIKSHQKSWIIRAYKSRLRKNVLSLPNILIAIIDK